ncbi:hypothetical protein ABTY96_03230 [Streptomyces sp. NPDC096057]|uniref:hypothetical protein n=1 Tax=Streptomyces sp. NPDC096057 TaxID=3155543 RepID=UPI00332A5583
MTDRDGDVWRLDEESGYYTSPGLFHRTLDEIKREFGPLKDGPGDARILLAEALEDVARKLREAV